ncbi:beta-galactosidase [Paenibacillus qinlingensis]|uniref:Beta-galactosidase n=1 Tax=Paenibacillus qinlingensis TaxID=1837343 RepID=A0ABU1NT35_9BACL|nr:beta-galactosidase [Paenibacillus qinlingensis]MDR6550619.1 beta-galactosidase [Paenibacillus qinlingensis]
MNVCNTQEAFVQLSADALRINGKPEIVVCASLFYFRLPRALWKERLQKVKAYGYNAIDVYFPWNYHEKEEGNWDFSEEKDAAQFLQDASQAGLWVIARPGPYICSEWDGGALPAYLFVKDNLHIRQNDQHYLQNVARWYDRILPILKSYQFGQGGTIIAVQLENELDFYPCTDPKGYISALRDMALAHGITVPLIACAGQGGLVEASGLAEGVVPTCNFYPNDRDPVLEEKVLHYKSELGKTGLPLLVTETNRSHYLLRRLLSCGVKLLGPYLQASGTNIGFTNAINNWGNPLSFLTSDYDFHGMITPEGHVRDEAFEGRLLYQVIQVYGSSLAEAEPDAKDSGPYFQLALKQGGCLLFLCNVTDQDECAYLPTEQASLPSYSTLIAKPGRCPILPIGIPMHTWGLDEGTLVYATAELSMVRHTNDRTLFFFHSEDEGEISFQFQSELHVVKNTMKLCEQKGSSLTVSFQAEEQASSVLIRLEGDRLIELVGISRSQALLLAFIDDSGQMCYSTKIDRVTEPREVDVNWTLSQLSPSSPIAEETISLGDQADYLEKHGVYRGFAWYSSELAMPLAQETYKGVLIQQASDVVSIYAGATYLGTVTPGGGSHYLPFIEDSDRDCDLRMRVEIWGHTNFHDKRLPALSLNGLKGLTGVVGVTSTIDLRRNWRVKHLQSDADRDIFADPVHDDSLWPIVGLGGWLSADQPSYECYRKQIKLNAGANAWVLHANGMVANAFIYVNGHALGQLNPHNPFFDLTPYVEAGETAILTVYLVKSYETLSGQIDLYEGTKATKWSLSACEEDGLLKHAELAKANATPVDAAVTLTPGDLAWLYGTLSNTNEGRGWRVYASGSDMKLTVIFNGLVVGRLWTKGGANRPEFRGGNEESFYLPGPWFKEEGSGSEMVILLEAVGASEHAWLEPLRFVPIAEA